MTITESTEDMVFTVAGNIRFYFVKSGSPDNSTDLRKLLMVSTARGRDLWMGRRSYTFDQIDTIATALDVPAVDFLDDTFSWTERGLYGYNNVEAEVARRWHGSDESHAWAHKRMLATEQKKADEDIEYLRSLMASGFTTTDRGVLGGIRRLADDIRDLVNKVAQEA